MLKVVTLFLIGIAVLAMFGRLRWPRRRGGSKGGGRDTRPGGGPGGAVPPRPRTCPTCGRMNLRGGACRSCREDPDA